MSEYCAGDIRTALSKLPIGDGDIVFIHSNIGFFGRMEGRSGVGDICEALLNAVRDIIGEDGSVFVPTFTYSFPNNAAYDRMTSFPKGMGALSEYVLALPGMYRSFDPCYSVAGMGGRVYELAGGFNGNSFGNNSFFGRFHRAGGKILNFNFDAGSTFIHYAERCNNVDYRFDKEFTGTILSNGLSFEGIGHSIYVRKLEDRYIASFEEFDSLARKHGMFKSSRLGRGEIGVITADDTMRLITETLKTNPYFLTKGIGSTSSPSQ